MGFIRCLFVNSLRLVSWRRLWVFLLNVCVHLGSTGVLSLSVGPASLIRPEWWCGSAFCSLVSFYSLMRHVPPCFSDARPAGCEGTGSLSNPEKQKGYRFPTPPPLPVAPQKADRSSSLQSSTFPAGLGGLVIRFLFFSDLHFPSSPHNCVALNFNTKSLKIFSCLHLWVNSIQLSVLSVCPGRHKCKDENPELVLWCNYILSL